MNSSVSLCGTGLFQHLTFSVSYAIIDTILKLPPGRICEKHLFTHR